MRSGYFKPFERFEPRSHFISLLFHFLIVIFLDLLSKLYVRVLSFKVLVKIIDFVLVYSGKSVVNVS